MTLQTNSSMKQLKFLISLITSDNDFQQEQARAAEETARRMNVDIDIVYADSDAITQSQQLLRVIQLHPELRPDGIVFEAVSGTGLPHVARAAGAAGIGCVVLNCNVNYIAELRNNYSAPLCGNWMPCCPKAARCYTFKAPRTACRHSNGPLGCLKPSRQTWT